MQLAIVFALTVAIGAVAFALQNNVPVTVTFLLWRFDSALAMVLLIAVLVGVLVAALFSTPAVLRLQWQTARQRREIASLEQANAELRAELERQRDPKAPAAPSALEKMAPRAP